MFQPKLRRVLAFSVLLSALSMLPVQAAGASSRARAERERGSFSERLERWGVAAWDTLAGLFEKAGVRIDNNGLQLQSFDDGH